MILGEETFHLLRVGDLLEFVCDRKLSWPDSWREVTVTEIGINSSDRVKLFFFCTPEDTSGCWHVESSPLNAWEWIWTGSSLSWIDIWLKPGVDNK